MSKYIDAEKLAKAIKDKGLDCSFSLKMERIDTLALIDSLQQEQPEIDEIKREWYNKGYLKGRKESNIPARELGLPKSCNMQEQPAEQRALEACPKDIQLYVESQESPGKWLPVDNNLCLRTGYQQGYEQAEKDLALTWEDVKAIVETADMMVSETRSSQEFIQKYPIEEPYYTEVLNRFNKSKEKR